MARLKESTEPAKTVDSGRPFQMGINLGKMSTCNHLFAENTYDIGVGDCVWFFETG